MAHHPQWSLLAKAESRLLADALGNLLITVHHIGSTAIPTIGAKPIVDLIPVVRNLEEFDQHRTTLEALGYQWRGAYGLAGRRYCTKVDVATRRKSIHLHCYQVGSFEIERHLAFRDYLLARPDLAHSYYQEKARCQRLHGQDSQAYSQCKSEWIKRVEGEAIAHFAQP
ncbi:GrpB family protein [Spirosoma harenae]